MENDELKQRNVELFAELAKYPKGSKEHQDIVSKIVKNNLRLVKYVANKHFRTLMKPTINNDDLISEGYSGLLKAIELYQPEKGVVFASYAARNIQCYMLSHLRRERERKEISLEDDQNGNKQKLEDVLGTRVNLEEEIAEKDEVNRQMAWIRKNLDRLPPFQKKVLMAKYLSGDESLAGNALAKEFDCTRQNVLSADKSAITKLKKMYYKSHPEEAVEIKQEVELTREEKIELKGMLESLIATKLPTQQKRTMLCKFYSGTQKTNQQVAQETNLTEGNVLSCVVRGTQKLCTIYNGIKDRKHLTREALREILQFQSAENGKEL